MHVVIWPTTSENCTKLRAARAAWLFFLIQPISVFWRRRCCCRRPYLRSLIAPETDETTTRENGNSQVKNDLCNWTNLHVVFQYKSRYLQLIRINPVIQVLNAWQEMDLSFYGRRSESGEKPRDNSGPEGGVHNVECF